MPHFDDRTARVIGDRDTPLRVRQALQTSTKPVSRSH